MTCKNDLYMIVGNYRSDLPFYEYELKVLVDHFDTHVICVRGKDDGSDHLCSDTCYYDYSIAKALRYAAGFAFSRMCREEIRMIFRENVNLYTKVRRVLSSVRVYSSAAWFADMFERKVGSLKDGSVIYTFWCDFSLLALLQDKSAYPNCKYISRIHGYDLFDERVPSGRQPFRWYIDQNIDKLVFISQNGMEYYLNKHKDITTDRAVFYPLGCMPMVRSGKRSDGEKFLLVSCSSCISLKRIDCIIRALSMYESDYPIKWVHFGSGGLRDELEALAHRLLDDKGNVEYEFMGQTSHDDVIQYYADNDVACFITTSSTEGAPISVMEALAAGMPVIGTDVGDISRMIENNGVLLEKDPSVDAVFAAIMQICETYHNRHNNSDYENMCLKSMDLFRNRYSVIDNTASFVHDILGVEGIHMP